MQIRFMLHDGQEIHYCDTVMAKTGETYSDDGIQTVVHERVAVENALCGKPTADMTRTYVYTVEAKRLEDCRTCQQRSFDGTFNANED